MYYRKEMIEDPWKDLMEETHSTSECEPKSDDVDDVMEASTSS